MPHWLDLVKTFVPLFFSLVAVVHTFWVNRTKDVDQRLDNLDRRCNGLSERVGHVEQSIENMPSASDVHDIKITLTEMSGELKVLHQMIAGHNALFTRLESIVGRHEDELLGRSSK